MPCVKLIERHDPGDRIPLMKESSIRQKEAQRNGRVVLFSIAPSCLYSANDKTLCKSVTTDDVFSKISILSPVVNMTKY
jgi:hypothetical protein